MFIAKRLKKMAPPGLTPQGHFLQGAFGEHCVKLVITGFPKNMLDLSSFFQIDTVFMRDAGWSPAYLDIMFDKRPAYLVNVG
jgi:hypothetical protein